MSFVSLTDIDSVSDRSTDNSSRITSRLELLSNVDDDAKDSDKQELNFKSVSSQSDDGEWRGRRFANADSENEEQSDFSIASGLSQDCESIVSSGKLNI